MWLTLYHNLVEDPTVTVFLVGIYSYRLLENWEEFEVCAVPYNLYIIIGKRFVRPFHKHRNLVQSCWIILSITCLHQLNF